MSGSKVHFSGDDVSLYGTPKDEVIISFKHVLLDVFCNSPISSLQQYGKLSRHY